MNLRLFLIFTLALCLTGHLAIAGSGRCANLLTRQKLEKLLADWDEKAGTLKFLPKIYALLEDHLLEEGVIFIKKTNDDGDPVLEIMPERNADTYLNKLAASLWDKHQTRLVFDLKALSERHSRANYVHPTKTRTGYIRLPEESA